MSTPLESMRIVARRLRPVEIEFAFLGGSIMCLLVDRPDLADFRPTKDVDVIVEVVTLVGFHAMEERLRAVGFQHDASEGAPICRWKVEDCTVDIMPVDEAVLGMKSKWFREAIVSSREVDLGDGSVTRCITPAFFLATKLEAFRDRGAEDYYASHDIEDIITLVDGRAEIAKDVEDAPVEVGEFIAEMFREFLKDGDFRDAFPGHLSGASGARKRAGLVMNRLREIADRL